MVQRSIHFSRELLSILVIIMTHLFSFSIGSIYSFILDFKAWRIFISNSDIELMLFKVHYKTRWRDRNRERWSSGSVVEDRGSNLARPNLVRFSARVSLLQRFSANPASLLPIYEVTIIRDKD